MSKSLLLKIYLNFSISDIFGKEGKANANMKTRDGVRHKMGRELRTKNSSNNKSTVPFIYDCFLVYHVCQPHSISLDLFNESIYDCSPLRKINPLGKTYLSTESVLRVVI